MHTDLLYDSGNHKASSQPLSLWLRACKDLLAFVHLLVDETVYIAEIVDFAVVLGIVGTWFGVER